MHRQLNALTFELFCTTMSHIWDFGLNYRGRLRCTYKISAESVKFYLKSDERRGARQVASEVIATTSVRKPSHEGDSPSRVGLPPSRGLWTLHHDYRKKNPNCIKRQWLVNDAYVWVWRFIHPLSMHQFVEISICAFEKKKFKHFDVERPVKVCALTGLPRAPPLKL